MFVPRRTPARAWKPRLASSWAVAVAMPAEAPLTTISQAEALLVINDVLPSQRSRRLARTLAGLADQKVSPTISSLFTHKAQAFSESKA